MMQDTPIFRLEQGAQELLQQFQVSNSQREAAVMRAQQLKESLDQVRQENFALKEERKQHATLI
jgi:hypothetical protein